MKNLFYSFSLRKVRFTWLMVIVMVGLGISLSTIRPAYAAVITVTTRLDVVDANSGTCVGMTIADLPGSDGLISLREAVCTANTNAGADTISFDNSLDGSTPIALSISGSPNEHAAVYGDLDIADATGTLTITGNGVTKTIIDASGLSPRERGFQVLSSTSLVLENLTVRNGMSPGSDFNDPNTWGGGILNNGNLTLNFVRVTANTTGTRGGGLYYQGGTSTINNSTVDTNTSGTSGAGIFAAATVTINNSTISGNISADNGGGLVVYGGAATLAYVTVAKNIANSDNVGGGNGGGISQLSGPLSIQSTLVADNSVLAGGGGIGPDCAGTITSQSYNLIEQWNTTDCPISGGSNDLLNPTSFTLPALADNGGPTNTHALAFNSPAIDHIPDGTNGCNITYTNDQRGIARPQNSACEIGAFEYVAPVVAGTNGGDGPGGVGTIDGSSSLELWLKANQGVYTNSGCTTAAANGNSVACWADQSGNGRNATQSTIGSQPLYATNFLNGQPALQFDGSDDVLNLPDGTVPTGNSPYSIFALVNADVVGIRGFLGSGNYLAGNTSNAIRLLTDGSIINYWGSNNLVSAPGVVTAGTNYAFSFVYNTSSGREGWRDGTSIATESTTARNGNAINNTIGSASTSGSEFWDGIMGETVIYASALNSPERILVENYLGAKYNLNVATDVYDGDTSGNGDFDLDVAGIGQFGGDSHTQAHSAGMIIIDETFLQADGDWLLFGHNTATNANTITELPIGGDWGGANDQRWTRHWYVDVTGGVTLGDTVSIIFDFSEAGMAGSPSSPVANYRLLKRIGIGGDFSDITSASGALVVITGDQVQFIGVDVTQLGSNFTLGTIDSIDSPTALTFQTLTARSAAMPVVMTAVALAGISVLLLAWRKKNTPERQ